MKIKLFTPAVFLLTLLGCATKADHKTTILNEYRAGVDVSNGADQAEAVLIAKKTVLDTQGEADYEAAMPIVHSQLENMPRQEEFWFISFPEKVPSAPPAVYMVVIEKATGRIKFANQYFPGKEWMIEAALFGREMKPYSGNKGPVPF